MYGLNCYQCDSNTNPDCTEFFDHDNVHTLTIRSTECKVDASEFCIKTTGVWGGKSALYSCYILNCDKGILCNVMCVMCVIYRKEFRMRQQLLVIKNVTANCCNK